MSHTHSLEFFTRAQASIPGGVNSPVRAFKSVGGTPVFIKEAKGSKVFDVDMNAYIDYVGSWGPMIGGHNHPEILKAVRDAVESGLSFGAPTEREVVLAEEICKLMPSIEQVRLVNSGTEATMSAIRLARGFTGRNKIIKFVGCYHGHADAFLVQAGSGCLTFGTPNSPGVPPQVVADTLCAEYNNLEQVEAIFKAHPNDVAAIILEPIAGNMNCIPATETFMKGLRQLCDQYGTLLVMDEVMTGFRVALGGAQSLYGVQGDLTTLGKVIGGGMPVGAFGGRKEIMEKLSPVGSVYQAGTLSGNPIATAAGLASLKLIQQPGFYEQLHAKTQKLAEGFKQAATANGIDLTVQWVTGMFGLFFTKANKISNFQEVSACDNKQFNHFFHLMLNAGVYLAPSAFEAGFMSSAHSYEDIERTVQIAQNAFSTLKSKNTLATSAS